MARNLVNAQATDLLGLSVRQIPRLRGAYRDGGAPVLVHGLNNAFIWIYSCTNFVRPRR